MKRNEIKEKIKECLQKFDGVDAPDDKVSETLFNVYGQEINEICRLFESEFRKIREQHEIELEIYKQIKEFNPESLDIESELKRSKLHQPTVSESVCPKCGCNKLTDLARDYKSCANAYCDWQTVR